MTTFSAPDVSAISPPKLSPFPVPDAKDVCVDDDGAIDQSRMLASPKLSIPHSVKTHEPEGSRLLLTHLRGRTAQQQQQLALGGRMIQAEQNERWAEMSAWCGFLATNLEGACCRIEQMGEEKRVLDRATAEDRNTIRHLEYSVSHKNVKHLEQKIEKLQAEVREREADLEQVHEDLRNGIPVSLSRENTSFLSAFCAEAFIEAGMDADEKEKEQAKEPEPNSPPKSVLLKRMSTATRVALVAAAQAKSDAEKSDAEREAEDLAAMPNWSLDAWLESLDLQQIVTDSILGHVRASGGEVNSQVELLFMQKLGRVGSRDTVHALLRSSDVLDNITNKLWLSIQDLCKELEEEEEMLRKKEAEEEQKEKQRKELEEERNVMQSSMLKQQQDAYEEQQRALAAGEIEVGDDEDEVDDSKLEEALGIKTFESWQADVEAAERAREVEKRAREEGRQAAAEAAAAERAELLQKLQDRDETVKQTQQQLVEVKSHGATAEDIQALEDKLKAIAEEAEKAQSELAEHKAKEEERIRVEIEKEAEIERVAEEQRKEEERKRPKKWDVTRMDLKMKRKKRMVKNLLQKPDPKAIHDSIKISQENVRQLAYATSDVYFRGLGKIVGRAGTDAGNNEELMRLCRNEHCNMIDSSCTFEPPNFVIPTSSRVEWFAVADPENGLKYLGLKDWPKEARASSSGGRKLLPPKAFQESWDAMNEKLTEIGESPLAMSGFVCLRLYTGPMYFKYNNVLRGVSVPGLKAPLEELFMKLCQGNKYTNTLHCIAANINKLSRVAEATTVYRAPGGVLPKTFWDSDKHGIRGGVELGFMSTSRSMHAAMDYAKMSGVKLIFEIKQGMVARGADVSWLSMYPKEDEVLFAPLTACEVVKTRIEGSILVVELSPGAAPASLQEKSIEEKAEEDEIARIAAEKEAKERKQAIHEAARTKAQWLNSMGDLKASAENVKRKQAEEEAAKQAADAASAVDRERLANEAKEAAEKTVKAQNEMKKMEREEREAEKKRATAEKAKLEKLQKAKDMGEYMKKAALRERLRLEQDQLKQQVEEAEVERAKEEAAREALAARALDASIRASKMKTAAEESGGELLQKLQDEEAKVVELKDKMEELKKRVNLAEIEASKADSKYKQAAAEFRIEEVTECTKVTDPLEMGEKLEGWLSDPKVVITAVGKITEYCKKDAKTNRKKFLSQGAVEKLVRAMKANEENTALQEACCSALAALTSGAGAGEACKKAIEAGAIPSLVRAVKTLQHKPFTVFAKLANADPENYGPEGLKELGVKQGWIDEAGIGTGGGEEPEEPESPDLKKKGSIAGLKKTATAAGNPFD